jgi:NDP-hexose 2,3-dehydratase
MEIKNDLKEWFKEQQQALSIEVKEVPLSEISDWTMINTTEGKANYIAHKSGKYHRGIFLKAQEIGREGMIERFLLAPVFEKSENKIYGVALLARYKKHYLVQAKSEPGNGNPGHVQITTTIQASYTNMNLELSGSVPFQELYKKSNRIIVPQDGAQLYDKNNEVCFVELSEEPKNIPENFTWATAEEIYSLAKQGLVSEHVMQCLGASVLNS